MYYVVTTEPEDPVVMVAVNAIVKGEGAIPGPNGGYKLVVPGSVHTEGDGGVGSATLVIVAHASTTKIGGCRTWAEYRGKFSDAVDWREPRQVYVAACSTAGEDPSRFVHGSIAGEIKAAFRWATVWASRTAVSSRTQSGDWEIVTGM